MLVVIDANRFISALLSKGIVFEIFLLNRFSNKIRFISPELLFNEVGRNFGEIVKRSKLSLEELSEIFELMKKQIELVPFEEFNNFLESVKELSPHEKDIQYFALALFNNCSIWSNEKAFKEQSKIKILSDRDLLEFLSN